MHKKKNLVFVILMNVALFPLMFLFPLYLDESVDELVNSKNNLVKLEKKYREDSSKNAARNICNAYILKINNDTYFQDELVRKINETNPEDVVAFEFRIFFREGQYYHYKYFLDLPVLEEKKYKEPPLIELFSPFLTKDVVIQKGQFQGWLFKCSYRLSSPDKEKLYKYSFVLRRNNWLDQLGRIVGKVAGLVVSHI